MITYFSVCMRSALIIWPFCFPLRFSFSFPVSLRLRAVQRAHSLIHLLSSPGNQERNSLCPSSFFSSCYTHIFLSISLLPFLLSLVLIYICCSHQVQFSRSRCRGWRFWPCWPPSWPLPRLPALPPQTRYHAFRKGTKRREGSKIKHKTCEWTPKADVLFFRK